MQDVYNKTTGNIQEIATNELIAMYQSTANEKYLEEIIRRNKGLLTIWAKDYLNIPHSELEDLISEGYMALLKAVKSYKPQLGYTFTTWLKTCVRQHYNKLYNEATRKKRTDFKEALSYEELVETNIDRDTAYYDDFSLIDISSYITTLKEKQRTIVNYLIEGYSYIEISRIIHLTPATLNYHIKAIRKSFVECGLAVAVC